MSSPYFCTACGEYEPCVCDHEKAVRSTARLIRRRQKRQERFRKLKELKHGN